MASVAAVPLPQSPIDYLIIPYGEASADVSNDGYRNNQPQVSSLLLLLFLLFLLLLFEIANFGVFFAGFDQFELRLAFRQ